MSDPFTDRFTRMPHCMQARPTSSRLLLVTLALAVTGLALGVSGCAFWRLGRSEELVERSQAFQVSPAQVGLRLLVVGDSTAVGTGASEPSQSLPGLAAAAFPKLLIQNRGVNGARYRQVLEQLRASDEHFDYVLIMAGGNDVIRLTGADTLRTEIGQALARAGELVGELPGHVILMPSGNIGNAPLFFPPVSWLMAHRSRELHRMIRAAVAAAAPGVVYVDLYKEADNDPFVQQPSLNAADGLHPSSSGYRQWWGELQQQADLAQRWAAAR